MFETKISIVEIAMWALITFLIGFYLTKEYYNGPAKEFVNIGQYAPKYINYDDEQMLKECERYGLIYSFEETICLHPKETE